MSATDTPRGIDGLEGREPIGAAVTIGVKGPSGAPTERDRFHIVEAAPDANDRRPHHRAFAFFNGAPADRRRLLRGNIVHATRDECFEFNLRNQVEPGGKAHPQRRPFCVGDGQRAVRWTGKGADEFLEIERPNDRCEFRQQPSGSKPVPCKPWMRLLFRLDWPPEMQAALQEKGKPEMPSMVVKFTSGSWNTTRNVLGFFDLFANTARNLGIPDARLFGLPFTMQLSEKTNTERKSRFPVVSLSPSMDPVSFLMRQREQLDRIGAPRHVEALPDQTQRAPEVEAVDADTISGGIPGC